jgi:hypothetical protein
VRELINNTPMIKSLYTRMALDCLITYRLREHVNPGHLRRMEREIEKTQAQHFLIRQSEVIR